MKPQGRVVPFGDVPVGGSGPVVLVAGPMVVGSTLLVAPVSEWPASASPVLVPVPPVVVVLVGWVSGSPQARDRTAAGRRDSMVGGRLLEHAPARADGLSNGEALGRGLR